MSITQSLHDELVALEHRYADLVEPEKLIGEKVKELAKAAVSEIESLRAMLHSLDARLAQVEGVIGPQPSAATPAQEPKAE